LERDKQKFQALKIKEEVLEDIDVETVLKFRLKKLLIANQEKVKIL